MAALADLSEEERYLLAILQDASGIDGAEFCWTDQTSEDMVFRCYDYQYEWYREKTKYQVDLCARAIGKSLGMQMRAWAFPFTHAGEEMLLTAPEMIHLDPVTKNVEDRIENVRLSREFLKRGGTSSGFTHRPFTANFRNGSKIVGRIPQKDGRGVKGQHPLKLEMDEGQDYPNAGYVELGETLKYGNEHATWRIHGVSRGVRDRYYKMTQPESGFFVHRITAMHRPDWSPEERKAKAELYGSRDHPDYRRNILGQHGDATSSLFVLSRLMNCVDQNEDSPYNTQLYTNIRVNEEALKETGMPIETFIEVPASHRTFERTYAGMDVGVTNHPSEILIFGEEVRQSAHKDPTGAPNTRLKLLTRVHLERIATPDQRLVMEHLQNIYKCRAFAMDRTGLGLPIYQEIMTGRHPGLAKAVRAYNFSENVTVAYEADPDEFGEPKAIKGNVLEASSDYARLLVDQERIHLPWDIDLVREFQGQTYVVNRSTTDPYGKKKFSQGKFHALDAARMAILAYMLQDVEKLTFVEADPVLDGFLA